MAILQTDGTGLAITDNSGKPLLRTAGSVIQVAYGQTLVEDTINSPLTFVATSLNASIPVTSSTSQIMIMAFTTKNYTSSSSSGGGSLDFMVTGGSYSSTIISGASDGFSSALGGLDIDANYLRGVSLHFIHSHAQSAGTTLTYTLAAKGTLGINGRNSLLKSTIVLMEIV